MKTDYATAEETLPCHTVAAEQMPAHWLLARMGKRALRPGGVELTRRLLDELNVGASDAVVEFAPGLGLTARLTLARNPESYTAVERDRDAADIVARYLTGASQRCVVGTAEKTGLPDGCATVVYGEAMLSMQLPSAKAQIAAEAARLLAPGGRYGIHELCLTPDDVDPDVREAIGCELSREIHAGARPLTVCEWRELLEGVGLRIVAELRAPMHLLEPARMLADEGLWGAMRFAWNVARNPAARRRVLAMRRIFHKYRNHLAAVSLVAVKSSEVQ